MVDDLKKKKADRKRVALGQKHEVAYLRKIAKGILKPEEWAWRTSSVRKMAKAVLKLIDKVNKLEKKLN